MVLYHEKQEAALCGMHTINTLLQGPCLTEWDLAKIAQDLDALERQLMASQGVNTADFKRFEAEESGNVARDGMFSIQVLQKALKNWDISVTPLSHPGMASFLASPSSAAGYICNLHEHWFTIRPVAGAWWNFNSLQPAPSPVGDAYLDSYLHTLTQQEWSIYVVQGRLPPCDASAAECAHGPGRIWSEVEARAAMESSDKAKKRGRSRAAWEGLMADAASRGGVITLGGTRAAGGGSQRQEDDDLDAAIAASLQGANGRDAAHAPHSIGSEDTDLAAAIAASLGDTTASQQRNVVGASVPAPSADAATDVAKKPLNGQSERGTSSGQAAADRGALGDMTVTDASAGVCELAVKLPSSERVVARFGLAQQLDDVFAWLAALGWDMQRHRLCTSYPRKVLTDAQQTLTAAGVRGAREMLVLEATPR